ncbi:potassium channel family protein [Apilactobacillus xinyiensis]|uniref:potassium channel family protein n=1 Tax=Apilactobacillus xinyiensis TaxID=2841032 RepID=UPI002010C475|nr:potassium channel family protein [Apilactobacillus xinyiensis]MCL0330218.1 potassium channel family protein [Apilactobacillus xinyiensis]
MKYKSAYNLELLYDIFIVIIALSSSLMVLLDYIKVINIYIGPIKWIYFSIWIFYIIDYIVRFAIAKNKKHYLLDTALDLISLIPAHPIFVFFRLYRIIRIIRKYNLLWKIGIDGKFTSETHRFIYDTGFIYLFSVSILILIISSLLFAHFENYDLATALWWSITTATTVGYGDISPHTLGGKLVAAFLMIGGIGFIGLLTSTITDFFTTSDKNNKDYNDQMNKVINQIDSLTKEVKKLEKEIKNKH